MHRYNACPPLARRLLAGALLAAAGLMLAPTMADEGRETTSARNSPEFQLYRDECGGCHVPYPVRGLPAASWRELMSGLERHFGVDASLDAATRGRIEAWLAANARSQAVAGKPVLRITETRWFREEHDEVGAAVFRRPSIKSASNCGACHRGAAEGRFGEHDIQIPR